MLRYLKTNGKMIFIDTKKFIFLYILYPLKIQKLVRKIAPITITQTSITFERMVEMFRTTPRLKSEG